MKRLAILFAILICLGGIAYYVNSNFGSKSTSISSSDREFGHPREDIGKITIQKIGQPEQVFTREGADWYINGTYKVSQFTMPYLLQCLSDTKIQNIPSKKATKVILGEIARLGIQVKVYNLKGEEVKSYKVGLESVDDRGTVFLMDGSDQPYNMYLKGFDGTLRTRFFQPIDKWRDREVWQYNPADITEISVKYHKNQKESFKLTVDGNKIDVKPLSQFIPASKKAIDQDKAKAYISAFTRIYAEDYDNENARRDSISSVVPFVTVAVKDKTGHVNQVDLYPFRDFLLKNVNTKDLQDAAKIERLFLNHSKGDFMVTQMRLIKEVFRPYDFFLKD
ncbi:MAG: DUF4340 domain-containing protein [Saprospiraceae bacterium]|nr:DUF4340 domain-containing protein [Saprospiraceae bacterium]